MTRKGNLNHEKIYLMYNMAVPSAVISSVQGINTDTLVQSWSVTVSIVSCPCDLGSLVMKSRVITSKGFVSTWALLVLAGHKWVTYSLTIGASFDVFDDVHL